MTDAAQYTPIELAAIRDALLSNAQAVCPRCTTLMTSRPVGGGSFGLGYARVRTWLICPTCRRSALFDLKRHTRN